MIFQLTTPPPREDISKLLDEGSTSEDVVLSLEIALCLMAADSRLKEVIFAPLLEKTGITEGKLSLLMVLRQAGEPLSVVEIAKRIGVSAPTTSTMLRRMLAAQEPLVETKPSAADARSMLVSLSPAGRSLLRDILPDHFSRVTALSQSMSASKKKKFIELLRRADF